VELKGSAIVSNLSSIFLNDEWDMKQCEEYVRMGRGFLAHHERAR
jgi:hypothetical protein